MGKQSDCKINCQAEFGQETQGVLSSIGEEVRGWGLASWLQQRPWGSHDLPHVHGSPGGQSSPELGDGRLGSERSILPFICPHPKIRLLSHWWIQPEAGSSQWCSHEGRPQTQSKTERERRLISTNTSSGEGKQSLSWSGSMKSWCLFFVSCQVTEDIIANQEEEEKNKKKKKNKKAKKPKKPKKEKEKKGTKEKNKVRNLEF